MPETVRQRLIRDMLDESAEARARLHAQPELTSKATARGRGRHQGRAEAMAAAARMVESAFDSEVDRIIDALLREINRQDEKHGPYERQSRLGVSRLALATLEDEVAEAKDAWREERRAEDWPHTREEVLQVAAVAVRTLRDALHPETIDPSEQGEK
jgi:Zn-dependent M32 family carboxypeptidase